MCVTNSGGPRDSDAYVGQSAGCGKSWDCGYGQGGEATMSVYHKENAMASPLLRLVNRSIDVREQLPYLLSLVLLLPRAPQTHDGPQCHRLCPLMPRDVESALDCGSSGRGFKSHCSPCHPKKTQTDSNACQRYPLEDIGLLWVRLGLLSLNCSYNLATRSAQPRAHVLRETGVFWKT
jgi:hypothetical protein